MKFQIVYFLEKGFQDVQKRVNHRQRSGAITDIANGLLELDKKCEEDDRRRRIVKLISENVTKLREEGVEQAMRLLIGTAKNRLRLGLLPDLIFLINRIFFNRICA